jgi:hypothetical protein
MTPERVAAATWSSAADGGVAHCDADSENGRDRPVARSDWMPRLVERCAGDPRGWPTARIDNAAEVEGLAAFPGCFAAVGGGGHVRAAADYPIALVADELATAADEHCLHRGPPFALYAGCADEGNSRCHRQGKTE